MPVGTRARSPGASVTSATLVRSAPASPSVLYARGHPRLGVEPQHADGNAGRWSPDPLGPPLSGALPADEHAGLLARQLAAVVHEEAPVST